MARRAASEVAPSDVVKGPASSHEVPTFCRDVWGAGCCGSFAGKRLGLSLRRVSRRKKPATLTVRPTLRRKKEVGLTLRPVSRRKKETALTVRPIVRRKK